MNSRVVDVFPDLLNGCVIAFRHGLRYVDFAVVGVGGKVRRELMTELKNEVWRGRVGSAKINEVSPNMIDVVTVVPSNVGGFTIREMAVFDEAPPSFPAPRRGPWWNCCGSPNPASWQQSPWGQSTVVPSNVGGFTIREMAVFDEENNMIAICNTAAAFQR